MTRPRIDEERKRRNNETTAERDRYNVFYELSLACWNNEIMTVVPSLDVSEPCTFYRRKSYKTMW